VGRKYGYLKKIFKNIFRIKMRRGNRGMNKTVEKQAQEEASQFTLVLSNTVRVKRDEHVMIQGV
jgi:hypothetical protein